MLACRGLVKSFDTQVAVDHLSFRIDAGEIVALLGNNGSGKSTTFKMILGLLPADEGEIILNDEISIGYAPETPAFPPFLTAREVLAYYAALQGMRQSELEVAIDHIMHVVGLENSSTKVKDYSKGMRQRLNIGQALLGNPDLMILDEPTSGLDARGRLDMLDLLKELKASGTTILINSHVLPEVERVADRGIIMKDGRKMATWDHATLRETSLETLYLHAIGGASYDHH